MNRDSDAFKGGNFCWFTGVVEDINDLEKLMEKQQILYMRMALSDDSDAIEMKNRIKDSATMMGLPENVDMNALFSNMGRMIQSFKRQLGEETD